MSNVIRVLTVFAFLAATASFALAGEPKAEPQPQAADEAAPKDTAPEKADDDRAAQLAAAVEGLGPNCAQLVTHVFDACANVPEAGKASCDAWLQGFEGYKAAPDAAEAGCEAALPGVKQATAAWADLAADPKATDDAAEPAEEATE